MATETTFLLVLLLLVLGLVVLLNGIHVLDRSDSLGLEVSVGDGWTASRSSMTEIVLAVGIGLITTCNGTQLNPIPVLTYLDRTRSVRIGNDR